MANIEKLGLTGSNQSDTIKELEYELKQLADRLQELNLNCKELQSQKSSLADSEADSAESAKIEDTRKGLENDVKSSKTRLSQLDDRLKMVVMKLEAKLKELDRIQSKEEHGDLGEKEVTKNNTKAQEMVKEVDRLKKTIQDIENMLKKMKKHRKVAAQEGVDYLIIIEELREELEGDMRGMRERLEKVEDSQGKTEFRSTNNESRIEVLESQVKDHKDKLLNLSKDFKNQKNNFEELENKIRELKQQVNQKVDNDVFEQEVNCK